ncbi:hypothetical protein P7C71_g6448, partial [Lecanoromycetidae sp. Uapishka_2]
MATLLELSSMLFSTLFFYASIALILYILYTIYQAYATPLRSVPGPFLAKFTRLWLAKAIASRKFDQINIELHRKYGPVVRIAPNEYSIDDPDAANIIYRSRDQLLKSPRYSAWGLPPPAEPNMLTTLSIEHHSKRRREGAALYQMSALQNIEYQVDSTISTLSSKLTSFSQSSQPIDLAKWLQFFAFDTIGAITFDKPIGFLEKGTDLADIQETIHTYSRYGGVMGVLGEWHPFVFALLQLIAPKGEVGLAYVMAFADRCMADWNASHTETEKKVNEDRTDGGEILQTDFMSSFLAKTRRDPRFTVEDGNYHIISNVVAGGETTGIELSAAMYYLLRSPSTLSKLRHALHESGIKSGDKEVKLKQAQDCIYLQA